MVVANKPSACDPVKCPGASVNRSRVNIQLEREHVVRLDRLAVMKGVSRSIILAAAVTAYLSGESSPCEAASARPFERFARELDQLKQGQTLLIETIAFFVRDCLAGSTIALDPHAQAARALERARFRQFIERLTCHLQRDGSLVGEESAVQRERTGRVNDP